jgi:hypothetical protein
MLSSHKGLLCSMGIVNITKRGNEWSLLPNGGSFSTDGGRIEDGQCTNLGIQIRMLP